MAASSKTLLVLATLLILGTSQAPGLVVGSVSVTSLVVNVGLHCQANPAGVVSGNAAPLTDITVTLLLNNQPIASASTNLDGTSIITVNSGLILADIMSISNLKVRVAFPIGRCFIWANTNGALEGPVQLGSTVGTVLHLVVTTLHVVA